LLITVRKLLAIRIMNENAPNLFNKNNQVVLTKAEHFTLKNHKLARGILLEYFSIPNTDNQE